MMSSKLLSRRTKHAHSTSVSTSTNSTSSSTTHTPADSNRASSNPPGSSPVYDPPSPTSSNSSPSDHSSIPQNVKDALDQVHPTLIEYLSLFPNSSVSVVDPSQPTIEPPSLMSSRTTSSLSSSAPSPFTPQFPPNAFPIAPQNSVSSAFAPPIPSTAPPTTATEAAAQNRLSLFGDMPQQLTHPPQSMADLQNLFAMEVGALPEVANTMNMGFSDEVLMNEQWMNLMRDAGLFDSSSPSASGNAAVPMNGVESTAMPPPHHNIFGHEVMY